MIFVRPDCDHPNIAPNDVGDMVCWCCHRVLDSFPDDFELAPSVGTVWTDRSHSDPIRDLQLFAEHVGKML